MDRNKGHSREWPAMECMQTCLKAFLGNGKFIPIKFDVKLNCVEEQRLLNASSIGDRRIHYDYARVGMQFE
jgi:hypothetical protein